MTPAERFAVSLPSEAIRIALDDLARVEADDRYGIDMYQWHKPTDGGCVVCLAGAVMATSLGAPVRDFLVPGDFANRQIKDRLIALDYIRGGLLSSAMGMFADINATGPHDWGTAMYITNQCSVFVPEYEDDPVAWRTALVAVADYLAANGL
ncbi:hypothetical protein P7L78_22160 [Tistrella bauzanensis]|uniref:hypothetical protein n=1 Tax=Tistrella TaxID=171436 RepID=UPI0031F642A5